MTFGKGLFKKYVITKADGSPVSLDAQYFVLRLDTDVHAREAMRTYVESIKGENIRLSHEIRAWLLDIEKVLL